MWDEIIEWISDGFTSIGEAIADLFNPDVWGNSEVFTSLKFWLPLALTGGILYWVINQWRGKVPGLIGFAVIGGIATIVFAYFWAARDIEQNG
jgi:hypothetical protein